MRFRAEIEAAGKTAAGIQVPPEVIDALGSGKKPAVTVTIGTHSYRSTVAPRGGVFLIPVSVENRRLAGVAAGDVVDIDLTLDTAPRTVTMPDDLAAALAENPTARAQFERLSYSNQLRHVLSVEDAKTPETRLRRIDKVVSTLAADS
jgi:Bacteriocin-protection, YdeI or OmpD-Associated/Domain of unknown function (DUF1905)